MNRMISDLALALAGVCAYVFVRWASPSFCPRRAKTSTAKAKTVAVDDARAETMAADEVKRETAALPKRLRRRTGARGRSTEIPAHCAAATPKPQKPEAAESAINQEAFVEPQKPEAAKSTINQEAFVEEVLQKEAAKLDRESVTRLLAKKTERKARKAQEHVQQQKFAEALHAIEEIASLRAKKLKSERSARDACVGAQVGDLSVAAEPQTGSACGSLLGSQKAFDENFLCQGANIAERSIGVLRP